MKILEGAEPFFLKGSSTAVLLVHGYTGSPAELLMLGEYLHEHCHYTVQGILLPGHGTCEADLAKTTWEDWYRAVQQAVEDLKKEYDTIYIAGLSMGAVLALKAAAELPVAKAVVMAAPMYVRDWRAPYVWLFRYFIPMLRRHKRQFDLPAKYNASYKDMPTWPLASLFELVDICKNEVLQRIKIPTLIVQSRAEHTVNPKSAQYIYDRLRLEPKNKEILWLDHSGHIVTLDGEREKVFAKVAEFLEKNERKFEEK